MKAQKQQQIRDEILECLRDGEQKTKDILERVEGGQKSIRNVLRWMEAAGEIVEVKRGNYALPGDAGAENSFFSRDASRLRDKTDNAETINHLLNLYDDVLVGYALLMREILNSDVSLESKERFLKDFKDLTLIGDRLLKRWNLENFGYDANTRQAQEDAKAKARKVEEEEVASLPPEDRIVVVREYDDSMRAVLEKMRGAEKEAKTV